MFSPRARTQEREEREKLVEAVSTMARFQRISGLAVDDRGTNHGLYGENTTRAER